MANQKYDAFLTVARLGSFKAAAEELGYTQAGISYLVNALEKELGLTLFLREYGGVHLTTEGREVLGLVRRSTPTSTPWPPACASSPIGRAALCAWEPSRASLSSGFPP